MDPVVGLNCFDSSKLWKGCVLAPPIYITVLKCAEE